MCLPYRKTEPEAPKDTVRCIYPDAEAVRAWQMAAETLTAGRSNG